MVQETAPSVVSFYDKASTETRVVQTQMHKHCQETQLLRIARIRHAGKPQQVLDYFRYARTLTDHIAKLGTVETASFSSGPALSDVSTVALSSKRHKV